MPILFHRPLHCSLTAALIATLTACGGGDSSNATAVATPPPAVVSTTVSGAVVKGPVAGAQVCAFAVAGSTRGAALGSCTTTDASGNYSFSVPAGSGALWVEALGGTYTDETTNLTTSLPAGSALASLITANGASVSSMLTPLTTLALNAARNSVGSAGALDVAAFQTAATQLLTTFSLPSTLNISTTLPAFGLTGNDYGRALAAISRMVADGSTLASILATTQPQLLQAAYALAANPPPIAIVPPVTPVTPPTPPVPPPTANAPAVPTASGTVTVGGVTAANAATSLTPQADGFEISVATAKTIYRFFYSPPAAAGTVATLVEIKVEKSRAGVINVSYYDRAARTAFNFCANNCGVTISAPAGATHPVTVTFAATPLSGGLTLNGSLVGDVSGALWSPQELLRTTDGSVGINGVNQAVTSASDTSTSANGITIRTTLMYFADGSQISVNQMTGQPLSISRVIPPATIQQCATECKATVTDFPDYLVVQFANSPLSGGITLTNSVVISKTRGSLTSTSLGSFTPVADSYTSLNDVRTITFNNLGTAAQAGLSLVTLQVRNGVVLFAQATTGINTALYSCFGTTTTFAPACTGITVSANGSQVSFANTTLTGGAIGAPRQNQVFNGTLIGKGD